MADDDQVRFRCRHCGRDLPAGGPQPCSFCNRIGRDIIANNTDRITIEESNTAVLESIPSLSRLTNITWTSDNSPYHYPTTTPKRADKLLCS